MNDSRYFIEVKEVAGKGKGVFAKDKIPRGTLILSEKPLLEAEINPCTGAASTGAAYNKLSASKKQIYRQLHSHIGAETRYDSNLPALDREILGIYAANAFGNAVVEIGSRFNHSCIPNTQMSHQPETNTYQFRVIRDIETGEELNICYKGAFLPRAERQAMLIHWGFNCACPACEDTPQGNEIEAKRATMVKIHLDLNNQQWEKMTPQNGNAIHKARLLKLQQLTGLMRSVGLVDCNLMKYYREATISSAIIGNAKMAILWAEKAVDISRHCLGDDQNSLSTDLSILKQLKSAAESDKPLHFTQIQWPSQWL